MAHASVVSLVDTLEHILKGHGILHNKPKIEYLLEKFSSLKNTFLEDLSQKRSKKFRDLEKQIRDAAYTAQDIIDSHLSNQFLSICECCVDRSYTIFCQQLQEVIEKIDLIKAEVMDLKITSFKHFEPEDSLSLSAADSLRLASGGKNTMVGFDYEFVQIKDRLTGTPCNKLDVVSIVGMGGIGKTTLARKIYDDAFVVYHFYIRAWVTVSQVYGEREIFLGLLESMKELDNNKIEESTEELAEHLYKSLKGSRYLIVVDDVWDTEIWDALKLLFPDDRNGSRIILTTRMSDVALYANSNCPPNHMRFLNKDESWNLLKEKVFDEECCSPKLERIGIKIAKRCRGLPLAILLIGGLLRKVPRSLDQWSNIAENINSIITAQNDQCLQILSLSYDYLPYYLRACFLYMGIFPEDYEIPVSKLIWLWASEGFLKPVSGESLEDVGEKHLKDLMDRSLVLVGKRNFAGKVKSCSIHDLVRDLCIREAQKEKFLHVMKNYDDILLEGIHDHRRLSIHTKIFYSEASYPRDSLISICELSDGLLKDIHDSMRSTPLVRSLIFTGTCRNPINIYIGFRLLRVLDALSLTFPWFPGEVVELFNLRYLALTYNGELPESLANLNNLMILIVNQVLHGPPLCLPLEIWAMPQLRHLHFTESFLSSSPDKLIYENITVCLENLQTLSGIRDFRATEEVIKNIPNLKKLGIKYDKNSETKEWSVYCLKNLVYLHQLGTLKCHFGNSEIDSSFLKYDLPDLTFSQTLKKLSLHGWKIPQKDMTIIGSLNNLEVLKLRYCAFQDLTWETLEGEFCRLKVLLLEQMNLVHWRGDDYHFPSLEHLVLRCCKNLEEIPCSIGDVPTLKLVKMFDCSPSSVASAKKIQEDQQSLGNDDFKILIFPL